MIAASIVGGSGYVSGELIRLLLFHPQVELRQVVSHSHTYQPITKCHPNLRGHTTARFVAEGDLERCDVLFLALPHGESSKRIDEFATISPRIIDCASDFRLKEAEGYVRWYGLPHPAPTWLDRFVYGLPERYRDQIRNATHVSGVGCNAAAAILALLPLAEAGLLAESIPPVIDVKVGSSAGGTRPSETSHHPARSRAVRSYALVGHRHTPEITAALGIPGVRLAVTAVELVRGVLATAHATLREPVTEKMLWSLFRACYSDEPFVRIVKAESGAFRVPEPKLLSGTNYADVGFACGEGTTHVVTLCAIDNLGKGAAGSAIQCMNLMVGFPERQGLEFPGLHPI